MIRAALVLALMAASGCKKETAPKPGAVHNLFTTVRALRDEICACKDVACTNALRPRAAQLTSDFEKLEPTWTQVQKTDFLTVVAELGKCFATVEKP